MRTISIALIALAFISIPLLTAAEQGVEHEGPERWALYKHGILDYSATPIETENLLKSKAPSNIKRINIDSENFPVATSAPLKALALTKKQNFEFPTALPLELSLVHGKKIRLFAWIKAEGDVRSSNSYSAMPNFSLNFFNEKGDRLSQTDTFATSTVGAFPWHCYYLDAYVPPATRAIKLELKAGQSEQVLFTKFSWKSIPDKPLSSSEKQDPYTGSTASNVYYDGMTGQLRYGLGTRYTWHFLKGPRAGMKGLPFDLTTAAGLKEYFEYARTDSDEMNHGIMYLAGLYHRGLKAGVLPEGINEAWLKNLTEYVISAQDPTTGYWGSKSAPQSMGITFHFIEGLFPSRGLDRQPPLSKARQDDRRLTTTDIPRAAQIVDTTLLMQATARNQSTQKAGWPQAAYNLTNEPNQTQQRASLAVTGNAIELLRRAEPFVDKDHKAKIYDAISSAVLYILKNCVQNDGIWRQSDTATSPSTSWYMERILDRSHYLEYRHNPFIPKPKPEAISHAGIVDLRWGTPLPRQNSLRVYRWKSKSDINRFSPEYLIAIIESPQGDPKLSDPFIMTWKMNLAAISRWGGGWKRGSYILDRLNQASLDDRTSIVRAGNSFNAQVGRAEIIAITAANTYGEESEPLIFYNANKINLSTSSTR